VGVSFATKLRLALLWPALAAVFVAGALLAWLLPRRLEQSAARELVATARLLAPLVVERGGGPQMQVWLRELASDGDLRVTVIRADGAVVADSAVATAELGGVENHGGRPEVRAALAAGSGHAVRESATTGVTYAYAATLVRPPGGGPPLVFRLAQPVRVLETLAEQLVGAAMLAGLATLLATAAVSWWLSRGLFSPLARVLAGADRLAVGALDHRLEVPEEPELALLADTLNRLAGRVQEQVAAAQRERDHLHSILASMAEGVLVTDAQGRALLANPAFVRLFGVTGDVRGLQPLELARVPKLHELVREALAGGRREGQEVTLDRGDGRRHAALSATPLGAGAGIVVVARDVTPFVRLDQVRRDFVANVSHELKTPLAAIRGLAETLRDGALDDPATATRFLGRLLEQCRRLEATLEDLLTLSRLESPAAPKQRVPVDTVELVRVAAETLAPLAAERGVELVVGTGEEPAIVAGDPDALERLLLNLLDNAVKYNRAGGQVRVAVEVEPRSVVLTVADSGIGIAPEHLGRIFERFYRVDRGRARAEGGTGLGLAIVKHVAQLHGGQVEVESQPGAGTTFTVTLPRATRGAV
jgi:two-component system phosphate regulon sensor histidine kinase PhoR